MEDNSLFIAVKQLKESMDTYDKKDFKRYNQYDNIPVEYSNKTEYKYCPYCGKKL